jgi:uncharacterized protein YbaP (TraB family)
LGLRTLVLIAGIAILVVRPAIAAPAIWEVRDADSSIWLFGSIRNLPADLQWRTPLFDEVLANAQNVVFEEDTSKIGTANTEAAALARGIYSDGTLLTDIIEPETELRLREAADFAGVPIDALVCMRPWFAAMVIYVGSEVAHGFGDYSLASQLQDQLPVTRLLFLSTADEQLRLIDELTEAEQLGMLASTLVQLEAIPKAVVKLRANWLAGAPEDVSSAFLMDGAGFSLAAVERILRPRARTWLPKLNAMLQSNEENLVIVDTSNLVGPGNLLDMLDAAGFSTERVQ